MGGYDWHAISYYNGEVTLLMDGGQIDDMHPSNVDGTCPNDVSTGYNMFSLKDSLIRAYLNDTLYPTLNIANIVPTKICATAMDANGNANYGGYLMSEVEIISGANYPAEDIVEDKVRLMSYYEYQYFSPSSDSISQVNYWNSTQYPKPDYINRLSSADWLYCYESKCGSKSGGDQWWLLGSWENKNLGFVDGFGNAYIGGCNSSAPLRGVRPVITVKK